MLRIKDKVNFETELEFRKIHGVRVGRVWKDVSVRR